MHDIRDLLKRSRTVPQTTRPRTRFLTVHWNGPSIGRAGDLALLQADARYHVDTRGWDGLSYHYCAGREDTWRMRDHDARLAHCGVALGNSESLSVLVATGDGDRIDAAQYSRLRELIRTLGVAPRYVLGHKFWPRATACPGASLIRWLEALHAEFSDDHNSEVHTTGAANIRDESSVLSLKLGEVPAGTKLWGRWVLGQPVRGDSLWLEGEGWAKDDDRRQYVHASVLDARGYVTRGL
jgi:hypothetical protein